MYLTENIFIDELDCVSNAGPGVHEFIIRTYQ